MIYTGHVIVQHGSLVLLGLHVDGFWRLAGGKVDATDNVNSVEGVRYLAALRELKEETGLVPPYKLKFFRSYDREGYSGTIFLARFKEMPRVVNVEKHKFKGWAWFEHDQLEQMRINRWDAEPLRAYAEDYRAN